jgi:hypothetical protein
LTPDARAAGLHPTQPGFGALASCHRIARTILPLAPGPKTPDAWEREEFAVRIQEILDALEVPGIGKDVRLELQRRLRRSDMLRSMGICANGEADIVLLLRTINESANGAAALTLPVIAAVSSCMSKAWTSLGLRWIEVFDGIPLLALLQNVRDLGLEEHFSTALRHRLTQILGPPVAPKPPRRRRDRLGRRRSRPPQEAAAALRRAPLGPSS